MGNVQKSLKILTEYENAKIRRTNNPIVKMKKKKSNKGIQNTTKIKIEQH